MRLGVFVVVLALGAIVSASAIDALTVCPPLEEPDAYRVAITAWPPAALECTVEHRDGAETTTTYVPWWEWLCVALCALGVASFRFRVLRGLASVGLVVLGLGGWFLGSP